ncbi:MULTISPECIES: hypothetical protein [Actinoplanes]|uniref:hypothetical protein n=1 Tax=Actinoplanes TaxID=1865 RepID=UPI0005F28570|nr:MULTISPECIES: hypothetical protein [Actinoplanes]GLY04598.1 hypothetical protein Acsp01_49770 [Actinoplanes sp. NBRC 101535]
MRARPDLREASDQVLRRASLVDLRLRKLDAELVLPMVRPPLTVLLVDLQREMSPIAGHMVYACSYELEGQDGTGQKFFSVKIRLNAVVGVPDDPPLTQGQLKAFGAVGLIEIAHPYIRELVHSLSGRMGLPALVVELAPPIA